MLFLYLYFIFNFYNFSIFLTIYFVLHTIAFVYNFKTIFQRVINYIYLYKINNLK